MSGHIKVACPYCQHQQYVSHDDGAYGRQVECCETESGGCDRYYAVFWKITVHADTKKIEDQG